VRQVCLGTAFARIIHDLLNHAKPIITPLSKFLGPGGYLQQDVPVTRYIMGRRYNVAQLLEAIAQVIWECFLGST
jgi:hypothetical protein